MLELLVYLRDNGFKTYVVSGGTVDFMRVWTDRAYGIPPEQVIGSTFVTALERRADGTLALVRQPKLDFLDDGPGKPVAINKFIGRRPILAFGNSDGDQQMLQWTAAGSGLRLMGLVRHTDGDREWSYDRTSPIGRLDKTLDEALAKGWLVVDMKRDWRVVYPFQR
jgi:haloacid dehalogenase-like hydrolase